jgi:16S rRNA (guanine966-N2)-methyltransferase
VLDAFAGSGALGLEALSRGAGHALFIESDAKACAAIRANAKALGETANATVMPGDATKPPPCPGAPCGIVFLDPPYGRDLAAPALAALAARSWVADGAVCVVELAINDGITLPADFTLIDDRRYGKARLLVVKFQRADR